MVVGAAVGSILTVILCDVFRSADAALSVLDDEGKAVDWAVIYKFPKYKEGSNELFEGDEYIYLLPGEEKWRNGSAPLHLNRGHMVANTLRQIHGKKAQATKEKKLFYIFYNDDSPMENIKRKSGSTVGHSKGYAVFDSESGFWCLHSTPRFGLSESYQTDSNLYSNAQIWFCLTIKTQELPKLASHFIVNKVWAYDCNVPDHHLRYKNMPLLKNYCLKFDENEDGERASRGGMELGFHFVAVSMPKETDLYTSLTTEGGVDIDCFAKNHLYQKDIWRDMIAAHYKTSFTVQGWTAKSTGPTFESSDCGEDHAINNLLEFAPGNLVPIKNVKDHSKFGFSTEPGTNVVCIGDVNRQCGQLKRGGGFCCIQDDSVHNAFFKSQRELERDCSVGRGRRGARGKYTKPNVEDFWDWCRTDN